MKLLNTAVALTTLLILSGSNVTLAQSAQDKKAVIAPPAALTADDIILRAEQASYYAGTDGRADIKMTIHDAKGGTRERQFTILRLNTGPQSQKFYVHFKAPADVRNMAYLVWKHGGNKTDDRWMWLPALNLNKRIAPGEKRTRFVGSDFLYEDVSGRLPSDDLHELLDSPNADQYLIKNTPKDPKSVEFAYYTVTIDKKNFLPITAEYINKQGKTYRRVEATKIEDVDGYPTVLEAVASDLDTGSKTVNQFSNIKYNIKLKEQIFTERFLRRPPREVR